MSLSTFNSPTPDNQVNSPTYSPRRTDMTSGESPIKKYMRQNNFYLLLQQDATQKDQSKISTSEQLKNLKQFQRQLDEEKPNKTQQMTAYKVTTPKNAKQQRVTYSPISIEKSQKPVPRNDPTYQYRAQQTNNYGNKVMDKIKSFIIDQKQMVSPKSPTPKKAQPTFNVSSSIQKLHKSYQKTDDKRRQQYIKQYLGEEIKQVKPFKVDNPISLYLIQKRNDQEGGHKPLYQRAIDLARQKSLARLEKIYEKQQEQVLQEQQQIIKYEEMKKQKYSETMSKEKQDKFYHDLIMKEKIKNRAKQQQKIRHLKEITKQKPYVSKVSKDLFNKLIEKNELSTNFVQRNDEYKVEREKQKLIFIQKHDAEYCPFAPKISQSSRELAKKYYQRKKQEQERSKNKCGTSMDLVKKINQSSQNLNKSKSPSQKKPYSIDRTTSAQKNKQKQFSKGNHNQQNTFGNHESKEKQIPIYNRYNPQKKRTNSCFNIGCKK